MVEEDEDEADEDEDEDCELLNEELSESSLIALAE